MGEQPNLERGVTVGVGQTEPPEIEVEELQQEGEDVGIRNLANSATEEPVPAVTPATVEAERRRGLYR